MRDEAMTPTNPPISPTNPPIPEDTIMLVIAVSLLLWPVILLVGSLILRRRYPNSGPVESGETTSADMRIEDADLNVPSYRVFDGDEDNGFGGLRRWYAVNPENRFPYFEIRSDAEGIAEQLGFKHPVIEQWTGDYWTGPYGDLEPPSKWTVTAIYAAVFSIPPLIGLWILIAQ